ncbi:aldo/keto reductase [Synechococcus sp. M16CYN]|uniref:aldo/keto reductase n=1 Tax=Synechococcus sp. M16CYN TaxID=3103139 RepID=UPI00334022F8
MTGSGLYQVNSIGFGTWAWGNAFVWGYNPEKDDMRLAATFRQALNAGINLIDTADSYGTGFWNGRSESLLGRFISALPAHRRSHLLVATKLAPFPWRQGRRGLDRAFAASAKRLNGNLRRVQLHWSTARYAPWQEVALLDGLGDLVQKGQVEELGLSNIGPQRLAWMYDRLIARGISLSSVQIQWSLVSPDEPRTQELLDLCSELGIEVLAYSPLAFGMLCCEPGREPRPTTWVRRQLFRRLLPDSFRIRQLVYAIAKERGVPMVQVALNWCRAKGTTPIPGIRTPKQAIDVAGALTWNLLEDECIELDRERSRCVTRMPSNPFQSR